MNAARRLTKKGHDVWSRRSQSDTIAIPDIRQLPLAQDHQKRKTLTDIPGPKSLPLIGALWQYLPGGPFFGVDFNDSVRSLHKMYGDLVREDLIPGFSVIRLFNPAHFVDVYRAEGETPSRACFGMMNKYNTLYNNNTQGLLTSQGVEWQRLRREVQVKIATPRAVRSYVSDQMDVAADFIDRVDVLRDTNGRVEDFQQELYKYVIEAIGTVCFDRRLEVLNPKYVQAQKLLQAAKTTMKLTHEELFTPPLYKLYNTPMFKDYCQSLNVIQRISEEYINNALKKELDGESLNLVQYLMLKSKLSYKETNVVLSELLFGGIDSTGHCIAFCLHALSKYPKVQHQLYNEINDLSSQDIKNGAIEHSPYLRAFLKETLRMYPVAPGLGRTTTKDTTICGYDIPAGTNFVLHYDMVGMDERFVKNPTEFKPERWIRPVPDQVTPYATVPFGFGPRSCPARRLALQEVSLLLIKLLQKYRIAETNDNMPIKMQLMNGPANPVSFTFKSR